MKEKEFTINIKVNDETQILTNPKKVKDDITNLKKTFDNQPVINSKVLTDSIKNLGVYTRFVNTLATNIDSFAQKGVPRIKELAQEIESINKKAQEGRGKRLYEANKNMKAFGDADGSVNIALEPIISAVNYEAVLLKKAIGGFFKELGKGTPTIQSSMTGQKYYDEDERKKGDAEYMKKMEEYIDSPVTGDLQSPVFYY